MLMTNAPPRHVKVTTYMPPATVADLEVRRADLRRVGINVDRGMVIRAAIAVAEANPEAWREAIEEERTREEVDNSGS